LTKAIENIKPLSSLNLSNTKLTEKGVAEIFKEFEHLPKVIDLSFNLLKASGAILVGNALKDKMSKIKILNLESNKIGDIGC